MGEQDMEEDTTFTYTWTTYNALGLPVGVWVGTNDNGASDADPTGGRNGNMALNNMLQTTAYVYDEGNGGGDGLLTQEIDYVDSSTQRDTDYLYNWRDELAYTIEPAVTEPNGDSYQTYTYDAYDNLGEETVEATYAAGGTYVTGAGGPYLNSAPTGDGDTLLTQTGTAYDNLGQVYQTTTYDVEGGSVNTPGNLVDNYWRDADGNVLAYQAGGTDEFTKYAYNTLGETTNEYAGYDSVDEGGTMDYAEASSVTANDTILEQTDYTYDAAGNVTMEADHQRFLGDAPAGSGGTEGLLTGTTSRTSYTAYWYNGIGHETYSADYGMQTSTPSRSEAGPPARESSSTLVNPDTVLVTSYAYNNDGELYQTTDPMGNTDQTTYDAAGRVTESIENYVYGKPTLGNQDQTDQDVTTDYVYEVPGTPQETTMTVTTSDGNKGVNTQQTTYVYGTDVSDNGTAADPEIYSNDLLRAVIYADSDNTFTPPVDGSTGTLNDYSGYNRVQYTYDLQGEVTSMEDQNQTVHTYGYDSLGRETSDAVTSHQNGKIDTSVMQIDQSYDDEGNLADVASLNASAQTVNDVQMTYNGMGEMEDEYQEHIGQVDTSNSLYTAYGYSGASDGNYRLTSIADPTYAGSSTSPNQIDFNYSGSDATDNAINRLYSIEYGSSGSPSTVATYGYLGLDSIVQQQYNQPGLALSYAGTPDANGVVKGYTGLNQFNKVVDQVWSQAGNPNAADEFQYGYDQAGDVMYKLNKAADALAGIVMPPFVDVGDSPAAQQGSATPYLDELYSYNNLGELTGMSRGEIEPSSITAGTPSMDSTNLTQDWDLDGMGNWSSYTSTPSTTGGTGSSASETRQVNGSNQIISSTGIVLPSYDNVGNMTTMPSPSDPSTTSLDAKYDAWGRLTEVDHGSQPLAMYQYDGLGRLVVEATGFSSGDTTWGSASTYTHYYYAAGQVVETRVTTSATQAPAGVSPQYQYVWSAMTDAPILRAALSGPYEGQTIYYLTDAEGNVTTLVGYNSTADQWQPVERYVYDPYGNVTVYDATWITSYGTASQYGNTFLYGGMMYDAATGLYYASARWYNPAVGQFTSPDPTGFAAGDANLYRYVDDNPATMTDPWGLSGGAGGEQWDPGEGTVYSPDGGDGGGEGAWASQMGGGGAAAATSATSRVWKDNNGKVIIEGTLVGVQGNRVLIRRSSDGKVISVNAVDLGKAERDYVVGQQKNNGVYQTGTVSTNSGKTRGKVLLIVGRTVVLLTEDGKVVSVAITSLRKQDQKTVVRLKTFLSVREALKDWAGTYWLVTIGGGVEYASNIWARRQADGSYIYGYTSPNSGMPGGRSVDPPGITDIPNGTQIIGQIHSHPNGGALNFSTIRTAGQNSDEFYIQAMDPITQQTLGITLQYYLVNPNGDLLIWDRDKHKGVQFGE
jgi:RHS repeat-associated protein